jgi:predicted acyl esterase
METYDTTKLSHDGRRGLRRLLDAREACGVMLGTLALVCSAAQAQSFPPVFSYDRPDEYAIALSKDILVPMRDGFRLTCDLYQPAAPTGGAAPGRFPSFVYQYHGYGRFVSSQGEGPIQNFAAKGYNVISCNTRGSQGTGGSSPAPQSVALINPWSETEQQDNYDLIEWLAAQPWSNGKVGQSGTSYGGITTFLVAARQRPPHLVAIAPITAPTDNYRHFTYPGGIPSTDTRGQWPAACSVTTGEPTCTPRLSAEFDLHRNFDDYWSVRRSDLSTISIPTLYFTGQMDIFSASTNHIMSQMGKKPQFSLVLGPWTHENVFRPASGEPAMPPGVLLAFFDQWLAGRTGVPSIPRYAAYQMPIAGLDQDRWKGFSAFPPANSKPVRYMLSADGTLKEQNAAAGLVSYLAATGEVTFETPEFSSQAVVAGPIAVNLLATFNTSDMNLFARVDTVDAAGTVTNMGYGDQIKMSHRDSDSNPSDIVPGLTYSVKLNIPSKFWTVPTGQKLRLTVKSVDSTSLEAVPPSGFVTLSTGTSASFVNLNLWQPSTNN